MQIDQHYIDGRYVDCEIPDANDYLLPGVRWGDAARLFTPAYWRFAYLTGDAMDDPNKYKLGRTLREEVVACLLGGHGITGDLGNAAFQHLRQAGILDGLTVNQAVIESLLSQPLRLNGRALHYRYPRQKARYIAGALAFLDGDAKPPASSIALRDWLTRIPGVGMKTAGWIARNWLNASDVAILDIHIHRAGVIAGVYQPDDNVTCHYRRMEDQFVAFARAIGVPANVLDHQMWSQLRRLDNIVRQLLMEKGATKSSRCGLPATKQRRASRNYELFANA